MGSEETANILEYLLFKAQHSLMRLTEFEKNTIIQAFQQYFSEQDQLWLFGSRVDDYKKGSDIDLYIQTKESDLKKLYKINFLIAIEKIGEQKVDIVIGTPRNSLPIHQHAKETGVRLT